MESDDFFRENEGKWKEQPPATNMVLISGKTPENKIVQYVITESKVKGQQERNFSEYSITKSDNIFIHFIRRVDVGSDGRITRARTEYSRMFPSNVFRTSETTYDYNEKK